MRKAVWIAGFLGACFLMTGCQKFSPGMTGISISEEDTITQVIMEEFQSSNYSEEELDQAIKDKISEYNSKAGERSVRSNNLEVKNGMAEIALIYDTPEDFAAFNNEEFYVGDMDGAIQQGFTFQGSFYEVSNGKILDQEETWGSKLMSSTVNYKVVVVSEPMLVSVQGEIRYVSEGVKVTDKSEAVSETNELAYILYE